MALILHDEQRADPKLTIGIAIVLAMPLVAVAVALGRPAIVLAAVDVAILALTRVFKLVIDVHDDALWYRLAPLERRHRHLRWDELASHAIADWSPGARGGWGIRGRANDRVYAMRGRRGVQLVFRDGRRLLLGSDDPEALERAIARARGGDSPGKES